MISERIRRRMARLYAFIAILIWSALAFGSFKYDRPMLGAICLMAGSCYALAIVIDKAISRYPY